MTDATPTHTQDKDASYLAATISGAGNTVAPTRVHHERFPLGKILLVPEENYRWGSKEAMERDLASDESIREDGTTGNTFDTLKGSIEKLGIRVPIEIVLRADGYYHILSGFTRIAAAKQLGIECVPVYVYDPTISDAEVELLQMVENARELKRKVNWTQEVETYQDLVVHVFNLGGFTKGQAASHVCRLIGKHPSTMKSRIHFLTTVDHRVRALAELGKVSCSALQVFLSGDVSKPYTPDFITALLDELAVEKDVYPDVITPDSVRSAIRKVKIRYANSYQGEDGETKRRQKTPSKVRQSPSILRDVSVLMARRLIIHQGLSLTSSADKIEALCSSSDWMQIEGLGMGAGDAHLPPVLETVVGERDDDDDSIARMQSQHEDTCNKYAIGAFIQAFVQCAMIRQGIKNLGMCEESGWLQRDTTVDGKKVLHRTVYYGAIQEASELPGKVALRDRIIHAWAKIRVVLEASTAQAKKRA